MQLVLKSNVKGRFPPGTVVRGIIQLIETKAVHYGLCNHKHKGRRLVLTPEGMGPAHVDMEPVGRGGRVSLRVSLRELADLSIGTPEVGTVNFNALHTLLLAILRHLNLQDVKTDLPYVSTDIARVSSIAFPLAVGPAEDAQAAVGALGPEPDGRRDKEDEALGEARGRPEKPEGPDGEADRGRVEATLGSREMEARLRDLERKIQSLGDQVLGLGDHIQGVAAQAQGVANWVRGMADQAQEVESQVQGVANQIQGVASQAREVESQVQGVANQAQQVESQVQDIGVQAEVYGQQLAALDKGPPGPEQPDGARRDSALSDVKQILQLKKRVEANEKGIAQAMALIQDIMNKLDGLKTAQDGLKTAQDDVKTAQDGLKTAQDDLKTAQDDLKTAQDDLKTAQDDLKTTQDDLKTAQDDLKTAQDDLKMAQDGLKMAQAEVSGVREEGIPMGAQASDAVRQAGLSDVGQRLAELEELVNAQEDLLHNVEEKLSQLPGPEGVNVVTWEDLDQVLASGWDKSPMKVSPVPPSRSSKAAVGGPGSSRKASKGSLGPSDASTGAGGPTPAQHPSAPGGAGRRPSGAPPSSHPRRPSPTPPQTGPPGGTRRLSGPPGTAQHPSGPPGKGRRLSGPFGLTQPPSGHPGTAQHPSGHPGTARHPSGPPSTTRRLSGPPGTTRRLSGTSRHPPGAPGTAQGPSETSDADRCILEEPDTAEFLPKELDTDQGLPEGQDAAQYPSGAPGTAQSPFESFDTAQDLPEELGTVQYPSQIVETTQYPPGPPGTDQVTPEPSGMDQHPPGLPGTDQTRPGLPGTDQHPPCVPGLTGAGQAGTGLQPSVAPTFSQAEEMGTGQPPSATGGPAQRTATVPGAAPTDGPGPALRTSGTDWIPSQAHHPSLTPAPPVAQWLSRRPDDASLESEGTTSEAVTGPGPWSGPFPFALETLYLMSELATLYLVLKGQLEQLDHATAGPTILDKLLYLLGQLVHRNLPPDLQGQLSTLKSLILEMQADKDKMWKILQGEGLGGAQQSKEEPGQLGIQLSYLRVTIQDIEKELGELRQKQEQGKAKLEQSVTDASIYLQDQLDKLRSIIEGMLASSSTLLSMSLAPAQPPTPLEPSQIDPHATCPACSLDVSKQVSQLVQRYEQLQDLVNNLMARQAESRSTRRSPLWGQDEEFLGRIQATILQVQGDCEKLNLTTSSLIEDHRQKQKDIDCLYQSLEKLEKEKADREQLEMEIEVKADKSLLAAKVSRVQFDATTEQLNRMLQDLLTKLTGQEQDWHKVLEQLLLEMDNKLDRLELDPLKRQLEERWRALRQQLKERPPQFTADDAAGIRRQLLAHFHCISCDRPLEMIAPGPMVLSVPNVPGLPGHRSTRPFTIYELEQVRQQSRNLRLGSALPRLVQVEHSVGRLYSMHSRMLQDIEKVQLRFGGSTKASSQVIRELLRAQCLTSGRYLRRDKTLELSECTPLSVPRRCGGSHTLTFPYRRYARLQYLPPEGETAYAILKDEVDILGLDGHIYKGRMETRLPAICKEGAGAQRKKQELVQASEAHEPSPGNNHQLPWRPHSAKMSTRNSSASSQLLKERPLSSMGRLSQTSLDGGPTDLHPDGSPGPGEQLPRLVPPGRQ
ncbi:glutamine-rich protein 2 [Tachyglossus aculeatus]|uniref:glutamine-rich protein 2 n=1 Tax=Tachyglossus aculeatus TaxID=9261 RepID=UPI0018F54FDD|nr:glutamine-rich protein 2 [Tachyglossus aculeatus]